MRLYQFILLKLTILVIKLKSVIIALVILLLGIIVYNTLDMRRVVSIILYLIKLKMFFLFVIV